MTRSAVTLTELARLGFMDLGGAAEALPEVPADLVPLFSGAADPDQALRLLLALLERSSEVRSELDDPHVARCLIAVLGASEGLGEFLLRHPEEVGALRDALDGPESASTYRETLAAAVDGAEGEHARNRLRIAYRRELLRLASWDLDHPQPLDIVPRVAAALADLAAAALDAALIVARRASRFPAAEVDATRLAIIGMGKAGARELNYVSDVDVIFVGAGDGGELSDGRAIEIATRLAIDTMHAIHDLAVEPPLWEVDANLRPEGKDGALVRTLESHLAYYDRWAKGWEFQALLKARAMAGDRELGEGFVAGVAPKVWAASGREGFVESVQRMRERVMAHIPSDEVDVQLKLGPGGLRDVEFTIQLLQLVHGQADDGIHQRGTLEALAALADRGYIGRVEAAEFGLDYRFLRTIEHRLQLGRLRRTHLMPRDESELRVLARSTRISTTADGLVTAWREVQQKVRGLHERLFYRPLLSAVAALPEDGYALTSEQAEVRLAAIGFQDPRGALHHIAALTGGVSRRAAIQRTLVPVMLQWFADGADPDHGLLAFRRLSDDLGEAYWFLRMLRDSSGAAYRLSQVLAGSRYVGGLLELLPEAVAWLESDADLRPRSIDELLAETTATVARHADDIEQAAKALRTARRREVLRLSLAGIVGVIGIEQLGPALTAVTTAILTGAVTLARLGDDPGDIEFGVIAMGRYGGAELGFGSDADIMYVYRAGTAHPEDAQRRAERIVHEVKRLTEDLRLPFDLDLGLRPEGKNGAVVRSLDSYRAYYDRWSLTWEAQALLRARGAVGDPELLADFEAMADAIRYPERITADAVREVKRIKARVESERLPQGADPARHLKLGRGSLSDVEWFVQLLQLEHAHRVPALRTTSTLSALEAAVEAELVTAGDGTRLRAAWIIASRARSALTLWSAKTTDVLPTERRALEGVARLLEYPPHSATQFEEDYLRTTRIARQVFERGFYGARV
ncbi:bifunctional [glutamine synthetase] adenylyltransferase/[glutamine synthetase]-adenylyl-L-tyrosine phosphorylase [Homoserinibacter sp. GY 40078]|uniref:bifunctional [glutamine synthetase] adenylyltransferase/[glutamine synthetase]-adenylyl-L-tyrosine phosphorylase n=1 Tax=Homoserinibacter sp. GY 40078 TaxID=2603275 RepID=UPI0011C7BA46|nr:bifunctional [glutamine synthetase] adenylyltransferase/[glutamine synthetase]-adenylyl-L-tyrosine phosphorylase [Homoserinibacter sp. GY 40078]TXK17821.1 bifunctional [glutamine synthetase] adenylyltransferase/[glutamine synthetase]-adenylyl-L-tyrosine phosphorylase [Homoserinibacter sp. GY 40078]